MPVDQDARFDVGRPVPDDTSAPGGITIGRARSECAATYVSAIASRPHMSTGPPFERLYAVEPDGVAQMIPSQGWRPSSSPPTASSSSIIRPSDGTRDDDVVDGDGAPVRMLELERRQLDDVVFAGEHPPEAVLEIAPAHRAQESDAPEVDADTGTPVPRNRASARSTVPSPPRTTARSVSAASRHSTPCFSASSVDKTSSTPCSGATACSRANPEPI